MIDYRCRARRQAAYRQITNRADIVGQRQHERAGLGLHPEQGQAYALYFIFFLLCQRFA